MEKKLVYELPSSLTMTGVSFGNWTNLVGAVNQAIIKFQNRQASTELIARIQNIADSMLLEIITKGEGVHFSGDGNFYVLHRLEISLVGTMLRISPLWEVK